MTTTLDEQARWDLEDAALRMRRALALSADLRRLRVEEKAARSAYAQAIRRRKEAEAALEAELDPGEMPLFRRPPANGEATDPPAVAPGGPKACRKCGGPPPVSGHTCDACLPRTCPGCGWALAADGSCPECRTAAAQDAAARGPRKKPPADAAAPDPTERERLQASAREAAEAGVLVVTVQPDARLRVVAGPPRCVWTCPVEGKTFGDWGRDKAFHSRPQQREIEAAVAEALGWPVRVLLAKLDDEPPCFLLGVDRPEDAQPAPEPPAPKKPRKRKAAAEPAPQPPADPWDLPLKGEPIHLLGVAPEALDAAYIGALFAGGGMHQKPPPVLPVAVNARPWVYAGGGSQAAGRDWQILPLYTRAEYERRWPDAPPRLDAGDAPPYSGFYHGCRVLVGKGRKAHEYVIGGKSEGRTLIAPAPAKEAKAT